MRTTLDLPEELLKEAMNGIGIPDLIIAQNAKYNACSVYSFDKHFTLLNRTMDVDLYEEWSGKD